MLLTEANERALLSLLLSKLHQLDADVFIGHNIAAFHLDVLMHRLQQCKVCVHGVLVCVYGVLVCVWVESW